MSQESLPREKKSPKSTFELSSSPASQPPTESQYEMIGQFVHGSSKSKAGDGNPTAIDMASPVTAEWVEPRYTNIETARGDGGNEPDGEYEKTHVSIGINQTIHVMAVQSGL